MSHGQRTKLFSSKHVPRFHRLFALLTGNPGAKQVSLVVAREGVGHLLGRQAPSKRSLGLPARPTATCWESRRPTSQPSGRPRGSNARESPPTQGVAIGRPYVWRQERRQKRMAYHWLRARASPGAGVAYKSAWHTTGNGSSQPRVPRGAPTTGIFCNLVFRTFPKPSLFVLRRSTHGLKPVICALDTPITIIVGRPITDGPEKCKQMACHAQGTTPATWHRQKNGPPQSDDPRGILLTSRRISQCSAARR